MNYTFNNKGLEYKFNKNYCGGGKFKMIDYDFDLVDIEIITEKNTEQKEETKLLGLIKNIINIEIINKFIIIKFKKSIIDNEILEERISLEKNEYNNAEEIVKYLKNYLKEKELKKQEEDNKHLVSITHEDGTIETVKDNIILDMEDYVLFSNGGYSFHTCTGCYKKWPDIYQEKFKGWKLISKKEALEKKLKFCNYCEEATGLELEDILNDLEYTE